jgi:hypothetical protein
MAQHSRPLPSPATAGLPPLVIPPSSPETAGRAPAHRTPPREAPDAPASAEATRTAAAADAGPELASPHTAPGAPDRPWYRSEAWLAILLTALVPAGIATGVPGWPKLALLAIAGAMLLLGLVLLVRRERAVHRAASADERVQPRAR